MFINLLQEANVVRLNNSAAAATSLITTGTVPLDQYDSALIAVFLGTVTSGSVMQLTAQDGSLSNGSDAANITNQTGSTVQTAALTDSGGNTTNSVILLDVQRIQNEYLTATFSRTTQNAAVNGIWALLYNAKNRPVTQSAQVVASSEFLAAS